MSRFFLLFCEKSCSAKIISSANLATIFSWIILSLKQLVGVLFWEMISLQKYKPLDLTPWAYYEIIKFPRIQVQGISEEVNDTWLHHYM